MPRPWRITRLHELPGDLDRLIAEAAAGLGVLYGSGAAREYRAKAPAAMKQNITNPDVYALAAFDGDRMAGFLLSLLRGSVAEIPFIHTLGAYAGRSVEHALVDVAVRTYRAGGVDGILCECLPLSTMDLRGAFAPHEFRVIHREIMAAELEAPGLVPAPTLHCPPLTPAQWENAAKTLVAAYAGDPGRLLHIEVGSFSHALDFLARIAAGSFGGVEEAASLVYGADACKGIILGCKVAPQVGFVLQVAVHPAHRGQGIATDLIRAQAAAYRKAGLRRVSLGVTSNNPARRLYSRLGFTTLCPVDAFVWWGEGRAP